MLMITAPEKHHVDPIAVKSPAHMPLIVEQFVCPNESCAANIPHSNVTSSFEKNTDQSVRIIEVSCPHCLQAYRAKFTPGPGVWLLDGAIEKITNRNTLKRLRRLSA